jgi:hypothetical protein
MRYRLSKRDSYIKTKSSFAEYTRFEDDAKVRAATKRDFVAGIISAPKFKYPKLDKLIDADDEGEFIQGKELETREAIDELRESKQSGSLSSIEYDLYVGFYEYRLKKIMLVEAASRMRHAGTPAEQQLARREFMDLNRKLYGDMNADMFNNMMATEQRRVQAFVPANARARAVRQSLEAYFILHPHEGHEAILFDDGMLKSLQELVTSRYGKVLSVVPETDDGVIYDAQQCYDALQSALSVGGLADDGWTVEISDTKSNPATNVGEKKIYLPSDTRRTASQLRRLIIHEQEVHARRGQNGAESRVTILEKGTADYAGVEEGLAVLLECAVAGNLNNQSYHRARNRYLTAGIALGLDGSPKDGRATFGLLWRILALHMAHDGRIEEKDEHAAKVQAMIHTENAFRGTNFAMPGVIYTKLKIYYEGLAKNAAYFTERRDDLGGALDQALLGKYNHVDAVGAGRVHEIVGYPHGI